MQTPTIAVAYGDGHAPAVMEAVLTILREAGANICVETVELGSRIYAMDSETGILPLSWRVLARSGVLLMAPIEVLDGRQHTAEDIKEKMGLADEPLLFINPVTGDATAKAYKNERFALFQPIYTEETLKDRGKSDPSPMLHAAIMMLVHVGQHPAANRIQNAWLCAMEDGIAKRHGKKLEKLTMAIIDRLGRHPAILPVAQYKAEPELENEAGQ